MLEKLRKLIQKDKYLKVLKTELYDKEARDEATGRMLAHEMYDRLFSTLPKNFLDQAGGEEASAELESETETLERIRDYVDDFAKKEINDLLLKSTGVTEHRIEARFFYQVKEQNELLRKTEKILATD